MFVSETGAKLKRKFLSLKFSRSEETDAFCEKRNIARLRVLSKVLIQNFRLLILRSKFVVHMISILFDIVFFGSCLLIRRSALFPAIILIVILNTSNANAALRRQINSERDYQHILHQPLAFSHEKCKVEHSHNTNNRALR